MKLESREKRQESRGEKRGRVGEGARGWKAEAGSQESESTRDETNWGVSNDK